MSNKLLYCVENNCLYIKIIGSVTAKDYKPLKEHVVKKIKPKSIKSVKIDLCEVIYMDSTFIGLLIGIDKILKKSQKKNLEVIHVSKTLLDLLKEVQVSQILTISEKSLEKYENRKYEQIPIIKKLPTEALDILEAHSNLAEISEKNRRKFALLTKILRKTCSEN